MSCLAPGCRCLDEARQHSRALQPGCQRALSPPPNGLELCCPAAQASYLHSRATRHARHPALSPASRVSISELLAGIKVESVNC